MRGSCKRSLIKNVNGLAFRFLLFRISSKMVSKSAENLCGQISIPPGEKVHVKCNGYCRLSPYFPPTINYSFHYEQQGAGKPDDADQLFSRHGQL